MLSGRFSLTVLFVSSILFGGCIPQNQSTVINKKQSNEAGQGDVSGEPCDFSLALASNAKAVDSPDDEGSNEPGSSSTSSAGGATGSSKASSTTGSGSTCKSGMTCVGATKDKKGTCQAIESGLGKDTPCGGKEGKVCGEGLTCVGSTTTKAGVCTDEESTGLSEGTECGGIKAEKDSCKSGLTCVGATSTKSGICRAEEVKKLSEGASCELSSGGASCADGLICSGATSSKSGVCKKK